MIFMSKDLISLPSVTSLVLQAAAFHLNFFTFNILTSALAKVHLFFWRMLCLSEKTPDRIGAASQMRLSSLVCFTLEPFSARP